MPTVDEVADAMYELVESVEGKKSLREVELYGTGFGVLDDSRVGVPTLPIHDRFRATGQGRCSRGPPRV